MSFHGKIVTGEWAAYIENRRRKLEKRELSPEIKEEVEIDARTKKCVNCKMKGQQNKEK